MPPDYGKAFGLKSVPFRRLKDSDNRPEILNDSQLDEWDSFVDISPQGSIYCRSWWLKAVCTQGFKILVLRKGKRIAAGMPLPISHRLGTTIIGQPQLTQTLGILFEPSTKQTYEGKLSEDMELTNAIIDSIPQFTYFAINFHYNFTNWLPLYWDGYKQTTRYTYVLEDLTDMDKIVSNLANNKRRDIKKAEQTVSIQDDLEPTRFYSNLELTLKKQGEKSVYYPFGFSRESMMRQKRILQVKYGMPLMVAIISTPLSL